jgi:hypothetical protein
MPRKAKEQRQGFDVWLPGTSASEAGTWALQEFSGAIMSWLNAHRNHDAADALLHGKELRHIVTRLDQFTREKERAYSEREREQRANVPHDQTQERSQPHGFTQIGHVSRPQVVCESDRGEGEGGNPPDTGTGSAKS